MIISLVGIYVSKLDISFLKYSIQVLNFSLSSEWVAACKILPVSAEPIYLLKLTEHLPSDKRDMKKNKTLIPALHMHRAQWVIEEHKPPRF